jgi:hypothetical protein
VQSVMELMPRPSVGVARASTWVAIGEWDVGVG